MIVLLIFAFLAGVVTILSPCILPLLPIILSSTAENDKRRPLGIVIGFIASFTFFTLFLTSIVRFFGVPADSLRVVSILILITFGASLLIPALEEKLELLFTRFARFTPSGTSNHGLIGGVIIGFSLGLLWTPCVGPILASVISLALTGVVTTQAFFLTLAYALGTAIPMFAIMLAGSTALQRVPWLTRNLKTVRRGFGVLMIATAIAIFFNVDRRFQTFILEAFPNYGVGLTRLEDTEAVRRALEGLGSEPMDESQRGRPSSTLQESGLVAPDFILGGQWFNSEPLSLTGLRGKVVLVDFWTYSCINCQRTLPYLRTWWEKYKDQGLVIIGVHSPEFEFEKDVDNVTQALSDFDVRYPVMQDNDFATWKAYRNRYWPAKYLIDKEGFIRYSHFGEGRYNETETAIRQLLAEMGAVPSGEVDNPQYTIYSRTPELYLGYDRLQYLASPESPQVNTTTPFSRPASLPNNTFAYEGKWLLQPEYAAPENGGVIHLNFEAQEVYLVARPKDGEGEMEISLDGKSVGTITIDSDRLYKVLDLPEPGRHELRIEFPDDNVEVYAFTFG